MIYKLNILIAIILFSCSEYKYEARTKNFPTEELPVLKAPKKENIWVFVLAGQSNMAGRAFVEPNDTLPNKRILTVNNKDQLIFAKEPLHFYEPSQKGLDLGMSFAENLLKRTADSIHILLIPTAIGGSSIEQWINDKKHRDIKLLSNFKTKLEVAQHYGSLKGIIWHQGESNANNKASINAYYTNLIRLTSIFRKLANNDQLPILIGELGAFSNNKENWSLLNKKINDFAKTDSLIKVVSSHNLKDKGDKLHFNAKSIRELGKRYAEKFFE